MKSIKLCTYNFQTYMRLVHDYARKLNVIYKHEIIDRSKTCKWTKLECNITLLMQNYKLCFWYRKRSAQLKRNAFQMKKLSSTPSALWLYCSVYFLKHKSTNLVYFSVSQEHPCAVNTLRGRVVDKTSGNTLGSTVSLETSAKTWGWVQM